MAELRQAGDGGARRWQTSGAGKQGLGRAAAKAGDLGLKRVAAPGDVLGDGGPMACGLELMEEEDNIPKKRDDMWALLIASVIGVNMSSIPSFLILPTKQKIVFNPPP